MDNFGAMSLMRSPWMGRMDGEKERTTGRAPGASAWRQVASTALQTAVKPGPPLKWAWSLGPQTFPPVLPGVVG